MPLAYFSPTDNTYLCILSSLLASSSLSCINGISIDLKIFLFFNFSSFPVFSTWSGSKCRYSGCSSSSSSSPSNISCSFSGSSIAATSSRVGSSYSLCSSWVFLANRTPSMNGIILVFTLSISDSCLLYNNSHSLSLSGNNKFSSRKGLNIRSCCKRYLWGSVSNLYLKKRIALGKFLLRR